MARLFEYYKSTVVPELTQKFGYKSNMEVPRITKITLNMGVGEAVCRQEGSGKCRRGYAEDCRPEAGGHQVPQVDRWFQDS